MMSGRTTGVGTNPAATARRSLWQVEALYSVLPWARDFFAGLGIDLLTVPFLRVGRIDGPYIDHFIQPPRPDTVVDAFFLDGAGKLLDQIADRPENAVRKKLELGVPATTSFVVLVLHGEGIREVQVLCPAAGYDVKGWLAHRAARARTVLKLVETAAGEAALECESSSGGIARLFRDCPWLTAGDRPIVKDPQKVTRIMVSRFGLGNLSWAPEFRQLDTWRIFLCDNKEGRLLLEVPMVEGFRGQQMTVATALSFLQHPGDVGFIVLSEEIMSPNGTLVEQTLQVYRPEKGLDLSQWARRQFEKRVADTLKLFGQIRNRRPKTIVLV